jgi:hypothetical protein
MGGSPQFYFSVERDRRIGKPETIRVLRGVMEGRSLSEIRDELKRLMREQIESLRTQTFGGLTEEELRKEDERLNRIREVSADCSRP